MKIKILKRTVCGGKRCGPGKNEVVDASKDDALYLCTRGIAEPVDAEAKALMKVKETKAADAA